MEENVKMLADFVRFIEKHDLIGMNPEAMAELYIYPECKKRPTEVFEWSKNSIGEFNRFTCSKNGIQLVVSQQGYDEWDWYLSSHYKKIFWGHDCANIETAQRKAEKAYNRYQDRYVMGLSR